MDRREFLRKSGFLTISVAAGGLAACGDGDDDAGSSNASSSSSSAPAPVTGSNWKFPQSVASGDPHPDGITLWTRIVPASADDVASATGAGDFTIRLLVTADDNAARLGTTDALTGTAVVSSTVAVYERFDHTLRNEVSGLTAAHTYYFQFVAGEVRSKVGRFRTAPANDAAVAQLKLACLSCQDWTINHWAGYSLLAQEDLDLIVHVGDYIYETVGEDFQTGAAETLHGALTLPVGVKKSGSSAVYANDISDYRYLYKRYRSDARLQAVHERFPFVAVWDDHEFSDDCWQDAETYDIGTYDATTGAADNTHQTARRRGANQAWFEYMPARITLDENTNSFANLRLYRDLKWGKLAHLVVTDERLYRADHIIPEGAAGSSIGSRYMVPLATRASAESAKIAAATAAGAADSLAPVSMLGTAQRTWWKSTMSASTSTWRLWCNEVSLLRMGLDGTQAIATLLALNAVSALATSIGSTVATAGSVPVAAAIVAAVTAGASTANAAAGATAIATASADPAGAAVAAGLSSTQAAIAVAAWTAASAASTVSAQSAAAAQTIAFGYIKPDIQAKGRASTFVETSGQAAALAPYFAKFLLNCDQWDGYDAERKDLVAYLRDHTIKNVVALTGDLHAFFAGEVRDNFDAADGGKAVLVDLVGAGISSDSFFNYFVSATVGSALSTLVCQPLSIPVTGLGTLSVNFNLFDYTLARRAPTLDELAEQARRPVRAALAAAGVPEASLGTYADQVLAALKLDSGFNTNLLALAGQLAGLASNPWIKHVSSDAQGYSLVTLTADALVCRFVRVSKLVGSVAPALNPISDTVTVTVPAGQATLSVSTAV
ncbi:MAG: alkaline phosphatase D family protein [Rhodocyclaceae bacterium]